MTVDLRALGLRSEYAPEGGVGDRRRRQVSHAPRPHCRVVRAFGRCNVRTLNGHLVDATAIKAGRKFCRGSRDTLADKPSVRLGRFGAVSRSRTHRGADRFGAAAPADIDGIFDFG